MSAMQRSKGAAGEREVCRTLHDLLGIRLIRNLDQSRSGGHDLSVNPDDTGPAADALREFAPEVKRHARATDALLAQWWQQTTDQAARADLRPLLIYRQDRQEWRAVLRLADLRPDLPVWSGREWTAEVSLQGLAALIRETAPALQHLHPPARRALPSAPGRARPHTSKERTE